jgi:hypothetical protein
LSVSPKSSAPHRHLPDSTEMTDTNTTERDALLPCPFCGNDPSSWEHISRGTLVTCFRDGCPAHGNTVSPDTWNTRTANTSEALLPCPFCGCAIELSQNPETDPITPLWWSIGCSDENCPAFMGVSYERRGDAIRAWNTRAQSAELASLRARCEAAEKDADRLDCGD